MKLPDYVVRTAQRLHKNGYEAWIVGGSVRDLIIGKPAYDYDIATDATPDKVMTLFRRVVPTGVQHGTVTVLDKNNRIEVTTFRKDSDYTDARRPDRVCFASSIETDISRRDFTINGIAYNPITKRLVDPYGGMRDIQEKRIRTIGDPLERFAEDGLRPYRACRFAAQLGFTIEEKTFRAISKCLDSARKISQERIRDEFLKIIQSQKPSTGLEYLRKSGLLELFLPELLTGYGINQNRYHRYDIYYHNLYTCDAAEQDDYRIRLAALFHDIGKYYAKREVEQENDSKKSVFYNHEVIGAAVTKKIMRRLKLSNDDIKIVSHLIRNHMFHYTIEWTDGAVRRFIRKVGLKNIDALFELRRADRIGNGLKRGDSRSVKNLKERIDRILEQESAITVRDLALNGHDIMNEFGLESGPLIGKVLNALLEDILDDPSKNRKELLLERATEIVNSARSLV